MTRMQADALNQEPEILIGGTKRYVFRRQGKD